MTKVLQAIKSGNPSTLFAAFFYFDVSFMIWVLIGALGVEIASDLGLSAAQKGVIVSLPLLGGSFFRIVLGALVDRLGPKKVGVGSLLFLFFPMIWGWQWGGSYSQIVWLGFFMGIAGASFAVALPLASRCYPKEHQGIALGIAGAGNSGTMISMLVAPWLAKTMGWHGVFGLALLPILLALVLLIVFAQEPGPSENPKTLKEYLLLMRTSDIWRFNFYYSVTFGGFVGIASFLRIFLHDQYHILPVSAGLFTTGIVFAGSFFRPLGGYLADRVGGLKILKIVYFAIAILFSFIALMPPLPLMMTLLFFGMFALGIGNGAVFQEVPKRFYQEMGLVSGIVGAAGGLGGFLLPNLLGMAKQWTNAYALGFVIFVGCAFLCLLHLMWRVEPEEEPVEKGFVFPELDQGRVRMEVMFGG